MDMSNYPYQSFPGDTDDSEEAHHASVKIHVPPTSKVTRWSHIEDLDFFFTKVYTYHQKHGFVCIFLDGAKELVKMLFVLIFCVLLAYFVDYDVLFKNKLPKNASNTTYPFQKVTIGDVVCSWSECSGNIHFVVWIVIVGFLLYWVFHSVKLAYNLYHFWYIKGFFNVALQIPDGQLGNVTWPEVAKKICEAQIEHKMCIRKKELTELDINQRILRKKNYMVAMINKSVLPIHHKIPFFGTVTYMSEGLIYNIELLLFSGTWGFFEKWILKDDYRKINLRVDLAAKLQRTITWFAIGNFCLFPVISIGRILYFIFNYAEILRREPGHLTLRSWSSYGRLYLRHFNELDHELGIRLKKAHRPATKYMNTFSSPVMVIIADTVVFIAGAIVLVLTLLTVYDSDVASVEHLLTIAAILGVVIAGFRGFIPDEDVYYPQEKLMMDVLAETHYLPDTWRGESHTTSVRDEFSEFMQYKWVYIFYELISPLATAYIFYCKLRKQSIDIIDFYRNFTVCVLGVGDVCSFSLMDMRRHGNPAWHPDAGRFKYAEKREERAEDGKLELSLIHFKKMNPTWQPPEDAEEFIREVEEKATMESFVAGPNMVPPHTSVNNQSVVTQLRSSRLDGLMASSSYYFNPTFGNSDSVYHHGTEVTNDNSANMSRSTLYLHSLHHRMLTSRTENSGEQLPSEDHSINIVCSSESSFVPRPSGRNNESVSEGTPLLHNMKQT